MMRENLTGYNEAKEILIAASALTVALTLLFSGGIFGARSPSQFASSFIYFLPIVAIATVLSFVLHELMHKFVAQHYGAIAGFRYSMWGLVVSLVTGAMGFLFALPGATVIQAQSFTKRQNGIVSFAGPLTNFAVFGVAVVLLFALAPPASSYLYTGLSLILFISIILAFFNMLPVFPLDGSKVLAWNKPVYFISMALIFVLMVTFTAIPLLLVALMLVMALFFSLFYRRAF